MKIVIDNVSKRFGKKQALSNISLTLTPGIYGLLGQNGAGKTTLMRCMTDIYKPTEGSIAYEDTDKEIGYLPQKFGLFKELTVRQMLKYLAALKGIADDKLEAEAERVCGLVNLSDVYGKRVQTLSGGMVRRLGIAQALLGDPDVIIVDEPTAGLDPEERMRFKNIIAALPKDKIVLISTHIVDDIDALCSKLIVLHKGGVLAETTIAEFKKQAAGHVFEIEQQKLADYPDAVVVKTTAFEDKTMLRILIKDRSDGTAEPTLEDAFILATK